MSQSNAPAITNIRKNEVGTTNFDFVGPGMRKPADFVVYPIAKNANRILIQSDTRMGVFNPDKGTIQLTKSHPNGANSIHLMMDRPLIECKLDQQEMENLLSVIRSTGQRGEKLVAGGMLLINNSHAAQI